MTSLVRSAALTAALAVSFAVSGVVPASATSLYDDAMVISSEADERRKANLAARQSMLVHRMIKTACFAMLDVAAEDHWDRFAEAHGLFNETLEGLKSGDPALGLDKETNERVRLAIADVERAYRDFDATATALREKRSATPAEIETLADLSSGVTSASDRVARVIDRTYLQHKYSRQTLVALSVGARERTAAQTITKSYCLIAADIDADVYRMALADRVELFEKLVYGLRDGKALIGLAPAPTPEIRREVTDAIAFWHELSPAVDAILQFSELTDVEMAMIAGNATPLVGRMNQIVYLYEAVD